MCIEQIYNFWWKNNESGYHLITGEIFKIILGLEFQGDFVHQVTWVLWKTVPLVLSKFLSLNMTLYSEIMEKYQIFPYFPTGDSASEEIAAYHLYTGVGT